MTTNRAVGRPFEEISPHTPATRIPIHIHTGFAVMTTPLAPGLMIGGRYLLQRRLGGGAQGEVYEVFDTHEHAVAALKLLAVTPGGAQWVEAQILRHLADPHILPIRNADVASGQPYLVTELALHGTLQDQIAARGARGCDVGDMIRWTRQACHGVARAHNNRLLHNDVKPGNLFLNAQGETLVGDFGFAALLAVGSLSTPIPGATPATAAPEIAAAWPAALGTISTDIYSLGATAFWLVSGRPPHDLSGAADVVGQMGIVANTTPPRLRDVAPHVPQGVAATIEKAISRSPLGRFVSVTDFAAALGARRSATRNWVRSDEHPNHLACWRGEPTSGGSIYVICLETGTRPRARRISSRHLSSGRRISAGCRDTTEAGAAQALRAVMRALT